MRTDNDNTPHEELHNKSDKYDYLDSLDTAKLQALLQQESFLSEDDNFDADLICRIAAILDERDPIDVVPDLDASLKAFKEEIIPELKKEADSKSEILQTKKFKRRLRVILIAAIVSVLLGSTLVASAFGYKIWDYVFSWRKDTFQIGTGAEVTAAPKDSPLPTMGAATVKQNKFKTLEEAVNSLNMYILVPGWIPNGFVISSASTVDNSRQKSLTALYKNSDKNIIFSVKLFLAEGVTSYYEIDEGSGEEVVISGRKFYFMTNIDRVGVVWVDDKTVYNISGDISKDDLLRIVKSFYKADS